MLRLQTALPDRYTTAGPDQLGQWIGAAKAELGSRLIILGHHYQRDEVMVWADARGDSFGLSRIAADQSEAEFVVFCGVHFMAESADILTGDHQQVILPDLNAGLLDGRHGRHRRGRGGVGDPGRGHRPRPGGPGHLHELVGLAQGLRGPPRRRGLHLLQRPGRADLGPRPRRPRAPAGRPGPLLPRPAPRAQHRLRARLRRRRHGGLEPPARPRRPRRRAPSSRPPCCCGRGTARSTSASGPPTSTPSGPSTPTASWWSIPSAPTRWSRPPTRSAPPTSSSGPSPRPPPGR